MLYAAGITQPPLRLSRLLDYYQLLFERVFDLPTEGERQCDGYLLTTDLTGMVVVNGRTSPLRQRFSIAHEIGHYELHRRCNRHLFANNPGNDNQIEIEANMFAACILMPEPWLLAEIDRCPQFDYLRDRFWTSKQAMFRRLRTLGLLTAVNHDRGYYHIPDGWQETYSHHPYFVTRSGLDPYALYLRNRHREEARDRRQAS